VDSSIVRILPRPPTLLVKDMPAWRASTPLLDRKRLETNDALFLDERLVTNIVVTSTRRFGIDMFGVAAFPRLTGIDDNAIALGLLRAAHPIIILVITHPPTLSNVRSSLSGPEFISAMAFFVLRAFFQTRDARAFGSHKIIYYSVRSLMFYSQERPSGITMIL
jgi:hypothetical protein